MEFVKTEVWKEAMWLLSSRVYAPVFVAGCSYGKVPFFQELRMRKEQYPFTDLPGVRYVRVSAGGHLVVVGPFLTGEKVVIDDELGDSLRELPLWQSYLEAMVDLGVQQAVIGSRAVAGLAGSLGSSRLLLEYSKEIGGARSADALVCETLQFVQRKCQVNNVVIDVMGKRNAMFDVTEAMQKVLERVAIQVRESKTICVAKNIANDFLFKDIEHIEEVPKSVVCWPLVSDREFLGFVVLFAEMFPEIDNLNEVWQEFLSEFVRLSQFEKMKESARTDALTGLYNRVEISERVGKLLSDLFSRGLPMSVLLCDVDNFKKFNDTYGHPEGDVLLRQVADVLKSSMPKNALCARYGGEEFLVVLPGFSPVETKDIAESFRANVESCCRSTISVGVMTCLNSSASWETMVREADRALYRAKHVGKNKVVSFVMVDKNIGVID